MRKMSRLFAVVLVLSVVLCGCGKSEKSAETSSSNVETQESDSAASSATEQDAVVRVLAYILSDEHKQGGRKFGVIRNHSDESNITDDVVSQIDAEKTRYKITKTEGQTVYGVISCYDSFENYLFSADFEVDTEAEVGVNTVLFK